VVLVVAGCGKGDPTKPPPKPTDPAPFAEATGVVVTARGVFVDGKSLGVLPERLLADPAPLLALLHHGVPTPLAYTEDAPAAVVLAAVLAIDNAIWATTPAPAAADTADEAGGTGTAMRLDEGLVGKPLPRFAITATVGGQPAEVCRAAVPPMARLGDDDRIELVVQVGHGTWQRTLSRVDDVATSEGGADLGRDLRTQKASAFFTDHETIVLTATREATGADLTPVLAAACTAGFVAVQGMPLETATAMLSPPDEPAPARRPRPPASRISIGMPDVEGDLDKAIIRRYIKRNELRLQFCYDEQRKANPGLAGTVQASFLITPAGTVGTHGATGVDQTLAACVDRAIAVIEFPKPKGGGSVQVTYPFTFRPSTP